MTDLAALPAFLDRLADVAADSIMPHFRAAAPVENKGTNRFDPVTVADRASETAMRALINASYPSHGIVGEEFGPERADAEFVWVLDPIDGTRAFITGLPLWGILIGLLRGGKPILGMMAQPFTGERFAGDGTRAWYTGPGGDAKVSGAYLLAGKQHADTRLVVDHQSNPGLIPSVLESTKLHRLSLINATEFSLNSQFNQQA